MIDILALAGATSKKEQTGRALKAAADAKKAFEEIQAMGNASFTGQDALKNVRKLRRISRKWKDASTRVAFWQGEKPRRGRQPIWPAFVK